MLVLREVEGRLGVAECLDDPRDPALITHSLADMVRFRLLMIAARYSDGNDAASLRHDPVFKMAQGIAPSGRPLASQPTISRLENMVDMRALLRMGFVHLLDSSSRTRVRVWAEWAPFDMKDVLKARGYRWSGGGDGQPKAWWTEVDEDDLAAELCFLEREVYLREVELRRDVLTAYERYRSA